MIKKLKMSRGESLAETMIAMMLIMLTFAFLVTAVVTSTRVNTQIENENYAFSGTPEEKTDVTFSVTVNGSPMSVKLYEKNGYYYYD